MARAKTIKVPHVEGVHRLVTWGWGVRLAHPEAWLGPQGESLDEFWWARRPDAERLALRYGGLGRDAQVVRASRLKSCTSPALNPWDEGFNAKLHRSQCGKSVLFEDVPNHFAVQEAIRANRRHARELASIALADKRARAAERKAARSKNPFDAQLGHHGDAAALQTILRGVEGDRMDAAVAHIIRTNPHARDHLRNEAGGINTDWATEELCTLARELLRSDPKLAETILRRAGHGKCRTAHVAQEKIVHERRETRKRERARKPKPPKAPRAPKAKKPRKSRAKKKT